MLIISSRSPMDSDYKKYRGKNMLWYSKQDQCVWQTVNHIRNMWQRTFIPISKDESDSDIRKKVAEKFPHLNTKHSFFTISEAAEYLGVSGNTLRNWDKKGKLPALRHPINNFRFYRAEDLNILLTLIEGSVIKPDPERTSVTE